MRRQSSLSLILAQVITHRPKESVAGLKLLKNWIVASHSLLTTLSHECAIFIFYNVQLNIINQPIYSEFIDFNTLPQSSFCKTRGCGWFSSRLSTTALANPLWVVLSLIVGFWARILCRCLALFNRQRGAKWRISSDSLQWLFNYGFEYDSSVSVVKPQVEHLQFAAILNASEQSQQLFSLWLSAAKCHDANYAL